MEQEDLRLVTIPFSHYCEKVRWGLDHAGLPFREEGYLPLLSWLPALRAGGRRTVPVLVTSQGAIPDSTEILRWIDTRTAAVVPPLFPSGPAADDVVTLEESFDRSLGPHARRVAYGAMLDNRRAVLALLDAAPAWQGRLARLSLPAITAVLRRGLRIDAAGVARSRQRLDEIFAEIGARLSDGRRYLTGDSFTAADLTFAALAGPVLAPPGYRGMPAVDTWTATMRTLVDGYRATPAGAFVIRMYEQHR